MLEEEQKARKYFRALAAEKKALNSNEWKSFNCCIEKQSTNFHESLFTYFLRGVCTT
jgi:hypothetical protein